MIQFGVQLGGGDSRSKIQPFHIELNRLFNREESGNYFNQILSFGIYFRVEGDFRQFGTEGPDELEYLKSKKLLGIDFVIPEKIWKENEELPLRIYFGNAVKQCFYLLLAEAEDRGFVINKENLILNFKETLNKFLINAV